MHFAIAAAFLPTEDEQILEHFMKFIIHFMHFKHKTKAMHTTQSMPHNEKVCEPLL